MDRELEAEAPKGSRVEEEAKADAGVTPDTRYWVARVPYPWALLQSDVREDRLAWEAEAERKHGNVALLAGLTWLWLLGLGWVTLDAAPLEALHGYPGACWAMQGTTFCLFEGRALLRNVKGSAFKPSTPNLGPLEPPRWLGRTAMVLVTALALHTDYTHQGGLTHDFMFERPGPMTQERAADWAAQNDLPDAAESLRESVSEAAENAEEIAAIRREVGEEVVDDSVIAPSPIGLLPPKDGEEVPKSAPPPPPAPPAPPARAASPVASRLEAWKAARGPK